MRLIIKANNKIMMIKNVENKMRTIVKATNKMMIKNVKNKMRMIIKAKNKMKIIRNEIKTNKSNDFLLKIQGYPQRMRLQRRLFGICFLAFRVYCSPKLAYFCA